MNVLSGVFLDLHTYIRTNVCTYVGRYGGRAIGVLRYVGRAIGVLFIPTYEPCVRTQKRMSAPRFPPSNINPGWATLGRSTTGEGYGRRG